MEPPAAATPEFRSSSSDRLYWEKQAREQGFSPVAGLDEAGRGPLAGPVVAAAVILPPGEEFSPLVIDSKKLSPRRREEAYAFLHNLSGIEIGVGIVGRGEIDRINILQATIAAMKSALRNLPSAPGFLLVDGLTISGTAIRQQKLIRGEDRSISIAAASIVAKVTRDRMMAAYDRDYPCYGFARHKGYGTREHLRALEKYGPSPLHRRSFRPLKRT